GISLRELSAALKAASDDATLSFTALRQRWFEKLLGPERDDVPSSFHTAYLRRLSPLESTYTKERATEVSLTTLSELGFDLAAKQAAANAEATGFLEALRYRRYEAKLRYELGFWTRFPSDGGTPQGYDEFLTESTGIRYRSDGYLSDMDAGFYSADYLRAWIRSTQLRAYLIREFGEDWWRRKATGDLLRALFVEGTRPSSEEVANRLGYDPLDTGPLVDEL